MFMNYARLRSIFTLWIALMGRLPTRDRLHKLGMNVEQKCCFCECEESINHLFFFCRETYLACRAVLHWLGISRQPMSWNDGVEWVVAKSKKKGHKNQILKIALAETV